MLEKGDFSTFHRLDTDELWHVYAGTDLNIYIINNQGLLRSMILGNEDNNPSANFQVLVEKHCWFAAEPCPTGIYTLAGCTLAPGYVPEEALTLANKEKLAKAFHKYQELIFRLTKEYEVSH